MDDTTRLTAWQIIVVLMALTGMGFVVAETLIRWATRPRRRRGDRWFS